MSQTAPTPGSTFPDTPRVVRMTPDLYLAAARRLVSQANADVDSAARRLVEGASRNEIDLSLCFGTVEPRPSRRGIQVRQACLAVRGSGRTAMLFVSEPSRDTAEPPTATAERAACIEEACRVLLAEYADDVSLAQSLPEPEDDWCLAALQASGFLSVGTLRYLRREQPGRLQAPTEDGPWPEGVQVLRVSLIQSHDTDATEKLRNSLLLGALERSYLDTQDCPELCGLRAPEDILESHRKTGQFDPALWWLVTLRGRPAGCLLLNRCPEQRTAELVYLGLGPELRGQGLSKPLLSMGIARVRQGNPTWSITCAVDERNIAAIRLYDSLGFEAYARRTALVRPIRASASHG